MPIAPDCESYLPSMPTCFKSVSSMIKRIHFTAPNAGFASAVDLETSGSWAARLSQTLPLTGVASTEPIRTLDVMNMPFVAAEVTTVSLEDGRMANTQTPAYSMPFDAHNVTVETLAFVRQSQKQADTRYSVWLVTEDDYVIGGKDGLQANILFNPADNNGILSLKGTLSFKTYMPDINIYPL